MNANDLDILVDFQLIKTVNTMNSQLDKSKFTILRGIEGVFLLSEMYDEGETNYNHQNKVSEIKRKWVSR